jgi:glycosyltransferase involved in cell wall biosynthesis
LADKSFNMETRKSLSLSVLVPVYNERYLVEESLKRVLSLQSDVISSLELIVVDDCSKDGSWEILQKMAAQEKRIKLLRHEKNSGKGTAIRTALKHASGDVTIIHDADLEYNPEDIPALLKVFTEHGADAVFGSRYISSEYRRVLMYRHTLINKCITMMVNLFTDLDLSDIETCYKAIKTDLFKSIPIRSTDFRFEVEISMKLARRKANIYEVPVRYQPRTYEEGKKIRFKDGLLALLAIVRYFFIEDIFHRDRHGLAILLDMNNARRFNKWMTDTLRPFMGEKVLEIGAGIGNMTKYFIPRQAYTVSDMDDHALEYLRSYAIGKPYMNVAKVDAGRTEDFKNLKNQFDTVVLVNVLEHVQDEQGTLANLRSALETGGKLVVLVPQFPALYGMFDKVLEHRERYTRDKLKDSLHKAGFDIETLFDFNRASVPSWYLNGKILQRKRFSLVQLKMLEILMPLIRIVDRFLPWGGLSLIAVAVKKKD